MMNPRHRFASCVLILLAIPSIALAQWQPNGTLVCVAPNEQNTPRLVADGAGGVLVGFRDKRNGFDFNLYAQHLDQTGTYLWNTSGVLVSIQGGFPGMVSDDAGGSIMAFNGYAGAATDFDEFAQAVDGTGARKWTPLDGVTVCASTSAQYAPQMIEDGFGGAFMAWPDTRNGTYDIYAQRIDATGAPLWSPNGVAVCTAPYDQTVVQIAPDGSGGLILGWSDNRTNAFADAYVQRINSSGVAVWATDGIMICSTSHDNGIAAIASDGTGGAIVAWSSVRVSGHGTGLYAQRLDGDGNPLWASCGVTVSDPLHNQSFPVMASDGAGGAVIAWQDQRDLGTTNTDIYAQRLDASGASQWQSDGVALCTASDVQDQQAIAAVGTGGAVVVWRDRRSGNRDVYAQRIDPTGSTAWTASGSAVCTATGDQNLPVVVISGSRAVAAWEDKRSGNHVYAMSIPESITGVSATPFAGLSVRNYPNPLTRTTQLDFRLPLTSGVDIRVYDIGGHEVYRTNLGMLDAGPHSVVLEPKAADGRALPSGVYFYDVRTAAGRAKGKMVIAR